MDETPLMASTHTAISCSPVTVLVNDMLPKRVSKASIDAGPTYTCCLVDPRSTGGLATIPGGIANGARTIEASYFRNSKVILRIGVVEVTVKGLMILGKPLGAAIGPGTV
jgi:hypothetical protein